MGLQTVGKHEFVLKLNRIDRRVRVGILESILYKRKEKVGISNIKWHARVVFLFREGVDYCHLLFVK